MRRTPVILVVVVALLALSAIGQAADVYLGQGYARIDNYAGFRRAPQIGQYEGHWTGFLGLPDFEPNSGQGTDTYLEYNTNSIRTNLRTDSYTGRSLWFETSGLATVGQSYSMLTRTDLTCDGHQY